ncbi:MAG: GNAT family N-acetyltransferase [Mycobacteriales bacterium]
MDPATLAALPIRRLTPADLPGCLKLALDRNWGAEDRKWALLLERGEGYGIEDPDGDLIGTTILTRYGRAAAAVSMVLIASGYARRGLGRRLVRHVLAEAGDTTAFLCATAQGRPLYEHLGFRPVGSIVTHVGTYRPGPAGEPERSRPAGPADLPALTRYDTAAAGIDRGWLLARWLTFAEQVRVLERDGAVAGYGATWRNIDTTLVGPLVADDDAAAAALVADLAATVAGPLRIDLDGGRAALSGWAAGHGIAPGRSETFMVHGRALPGARDRLITPFMQALG